MKTTFNVTVTMEERWVPYFQSFLKYMESMGNLGHSCPVAMYADGDGDFRPIFEFDIPYTKVEGVTREQVIEILQLSQGSDANLYYKIPEITFDAG